MSAKFWKSATVSSTSRSSSSVENWSRKAPVDTGVVSVHSAGRASMSTELMPARAA